MNTIAWAIADNRHTKDVYALFGATALWISGGAGDAVGTVWQYAPDAGRDEAVRYLTEITEYLEGRHWTLRGEPVEFDLSDEALAQILPKDEGEWIYAPTLREELVAAVGTHMTLSGIATTSWSPPFTGWSIKADPAGHGDFWVDYTFPSTSTSTTTTWVDPEVIG